MFLKQKKVTWKKCTGRLHNPFWCDILLWIQIDIREKNNEKWNHLQANTLLFKFLTWSLWWGTVLPSTEVTCMLGEHRQNLSSCYPADAKTTPLCSGAAYIVYRHQSTAVVPVVHLTQGCAAAGKLLGAGGNPSCMPACAEHCCQPGSALC